MISGAVKRIHTMIDSQLERQDVYKENRFLRQMEGFGIPSSLQSRNLISSVTEAGKRFDDISNLGSNSLLDTAGLSRLEDGSLSRLDSGSISRYDGGISRLNAGRGLNTSTMISIHTRPSVSSLFLEVSSSIINYY